LYPSDFGAVLQFGDHDCWNLNGFSADPIKPRSNTPVRFSLSKFRDHVRIEEEHCLTFILKDKRAQAKPPSRGDFEIMRPIGVEENVFNGGSCMGLKALPLFDGDEYSHLDAAAGEDLRPILERSFKELAEAGFCVIDLPGHREPPMM
jgi:hypothetical protein